MKVETSIDENLPGMLADAQALRIALRNILVNALKYGRQGGWVGVRMSSEERRGSSVVVMAIADRGIGIETGDLKKIFSAFYRGRNASDCQIHGSGLGLSLAHHVVSAHRGKIEVEGMYGKGSTFTVVLPAMGSSNIETVSWQKKESISS